MDVFGIRMLGFSGDTGRKLLLTIVLIVVIYVLKYVIAWLLRHVRHGLADEGTSERARFWGRQGVSLLALVALIAGLVSIWFDNPGRLATAGGLVAAGIAVALQRVITSFAAYLIILRGRVFTVGDRITMGGVRGDVIQLGFMQTTVMEMGEPPGEQADPPSTWVAARQYTGRIVRMTNDKIFDSPVYNYTREFPYLWEEIHIPIKYGDDYEKIEQLLLDVARKHTAELATKAAAALDQLRRSVFLPDTVSVDPHVYVRLTDNWIALSLRFIAPERGVRALKDAMSRDIWAGMQAANIGIASGTYEIVGVPPLKVSVTGSPPNG
jgi:small-conductance mechanosensitive channel